jgi:hypothetical protein
LRAGTHPLANIGRFKMIVSAQNFQSTDPTIDSQMVILQSSGADTLFLFNGASWDDVK